MRELFRKPVAFFGHPYSIFLCHLVVSADQAGSYRDPVSRVCELRAEHQSEDLAKEKRVL